MDVSAVKGALESFDRAQQSMEKQRSEERAIAQKQDERREAEKARKRQEEQSSTPTDKSAVLGKSVGLGEAIAMSVIAGILG